MPNTYESKKEQALTSAKGNEAVQHVGSNQSEAIEIDRACLYFGLDIDKSQRRQGNKETAQPVSSAAWQAFRKYSRLFFANIGEEEKTDQELEQTLTAAAGLFEDKPDLNDYVSYIEPATDNETHRQYPLLLVFTVAYLRRIDFASINQALTEADKPDTNVLQRLQQSLGQIETTDLFISSLDISAEDKQYLYLLKKLDELYPQSQRQYDSFVTKYKRDEVANLKNAINRMLCIECERYASLSSLLHCNVKDMLIEYSCHQGRRHRLIQAIHGARNEHGKQIWLIQDLSMAVLYWMNEYISDSIKAKDAAEQHQLMIEWATTAAVPKEVLSDAGVKALRQQILENLKQHGISIDLPQVHKVVDGYLDVVEQLPPSDNPVINIFQIPQTYDHQFNQLLSIVKSKPFAWFEANKQTVNLILLMDKVKSGLQHYSWVLSSEPQIQKDISRANNEMEALCLQMHDKLVKNQDYNADTAQVNGIEVCANRIRQYEASNLGNFFARYLASEDSANDMLRILADKLELDEASVLPSDASMQHLRLLISDEQAQEITLNIDDVSKFILYGYIKPHWSDDYKFILRHLIDMLRRETQHTDNQRLRLVGQYSFPEPLLARLERRLNHASACAPLSLPADMSLQQARESHPFPFFYPMMQNQDDLTSVIAILYAGCELNHPLLVNIFTIDELETQERSVLRLQTLLNLILSVDFPNQDDAATKIIQVAIDHHQAKIIRAHLNEVVQIFIDENISQPGMQTLLSIIEHFPDDCAQDVIDAMFKYAHFNSACIANFVRHFSNNPKALSLLLESADSNNKTLVVNLENEDRISVIQIYFASGNHDLIEGMLLSLDKHRLFLYYMLNKNDIECLHAIYHAMVNVVFSLNLAQNNLSDYFWCSAFLCSFEQNDMSMIRTILAITFASKNSNLLVSLTESLRGHLSIEQITILCDELFSHIKNEPELLANFLVADFLHAEKAGFISHACKLPPETEQLLETSQVIIDIVIKKLYHATDDAAVILALTKFVITGWDFFDIIKPAFDHCLQCMERQLAPPNSSLTNTQTLFAYTEAKADDEQSNEAARLLAGAKQGNRDSFVKLVKMYQRNTQPITPTNTSGAKAVLRK